MISTAKRGLSISILVVGVAGGELGYSEEVN